MDQDQAKTDGREPYSVERIEKLLQDITQGLTKNVWQHLQALCAIPGQEIQSHPLGPKPGGEDPGVPMIRIFEQLNDLKEIVNQVDIHMNNLGHELHPTWYDKVKKE